MGRKLTGKPCGPVPKDIDWKYFEQLCGLWCTTSEIASTLGIHEDTLRTRAKEHYDSDDYSGIYKRFFEVGTPSFRRDRRVMAKKNAAMSIWLGKVHLGEKEKTEDLNMKTLEALVQMLAANQIKQPEKLSND